MTAKKWARRYIVESPMQTNSQKSATLKGKQLHDALEKFYMSKLQVASKRCDECLFSSNKIVSDSRRDEILRELNREDKHFICHKSSIRHNMEGGQEVVCRGSYEQMPQMVRIAGRLGAIEFVDPNTGEPSDMEP